MRGNLLDYFAADKVEFTMSPQSQSLVLQKLAGVSNSLRNNSSPALPDDWAKLSPARIAGWRRVLSSIATSEGYESVVLGPISEGLGFDRAVTAYLKTHAEDEIQHAEWLTSYLKINLNYSKSKATVSDSLIYKTLLPWGAALLRRMPAIGMMVLEVYERFSLDLYDQLAVRAASDGLHNLQALLLRIRTDEKRHLAGLAAVQQAAKHHLTQDLGHRLIARLFLAVVRFDLQFERWGINNRDLKAHFALLDVDTATLAASVRNACRSAKGNYLGGLISA